MVSLLTPGLLARIMEEGERPNNKTVQVETWVVNLLFVNL